MNADNQGRKKHCNEREECRPRNNFITDLCRLTIPGAEIFVYSEDDGKLSKTQCGTAYGVQSNNGNNGY
uniref:Uncharacterized protein n=1 Tax=Romanomermis culicivorax TaxID=13658 RepID=A0A915KF13_ROMCU